MRVSVCMIVWNEEALLPRAVASTGGLADEIVIVDTGSTDQTVAVADSLGLCVLTGGDRMHKAKARNQAMAAATGDWVVILDADETIAQPRAVREFLEETDADAVYIRLAYVDGVDRHTLSYAQMRMWRRGMYHYRYRAHEVPEPVSDAGKVVWTELVWEHRPPPDRTWKSDYTLQRLLLDVAENPEMARPLYYLGRQYMYRREWQNGLAILSRYLATAGRDEGDAWHCVAQCYAGLGNEREQIKALHQACAASPLRREWWCELAGLYHERGQDQIAGGLLRCALEIPPPRADYFNTYWYGANIHDLLARVLWKQKRYGEGLVEARKAVELEPGNERLATNLLWFQSATGDMDAFYRLHGPEVHANQKRHEAIAGLVHGPRVLDFGCGTGDLLLRLQAEHPDWDLHGIDTSRVALEMAQQRGVTARLGLSPEFMDTGGWNTIVCSEVLEHVDRDDYYVRQAATNLVPGGRLVVMVPRDGRISSPDHRREYSEESLLTLLAPHGQVLMHDWAGSENRILATVDR